MAQGMSVDHSENPTICGDPLNFPTAPKWGFIFSTELWKPLEGLQWNFTEAIKVPRGWILIIDLLCSTPACLHSHPSSKSLTSRRTGTNFCTDIHGSQGIITGMATMMLNMINITISTHFSIVIAGVLAYWHQHLAQSTTVPKYSLVLALGVVLYSSL